MNHKIHTDVKALEEANLRGREVRPPRWKTVFYEWPLSRRKVTKRNRGTAFLKAGLDSPLPEFGSITAGAAVAVPHSYPDVSPLSKNLFYFTHYLLIQQLGARAYNGMAFISPKHRTKLPRPLPAKQRSTHYTTHAFAARVIAFLKIVWTSDHLEPIFDRIRWAVVLF